MVSLLSFLTWEFIVHQLRYAGAGLIATAANYATFWSLLLFAGVGGIIATGAAFGIGASVNFFVHRNWTFNRFKADRRARHQAIAYLAMTACSFGLNYALFFALAQEAHASYLLTEIATTITLGVFGYICTTFIFVSPRLVLARIRSK